MSQRVFLLFSGSNSRAIFALARVFTQCDAPFSVIAWKRSDPILRSEYRTKVSAYRDDNLLTVERLREWVAATRRAHPQARLVLVPSSEYLNTFLLNLDATTLAELECELPLVDAPTYAELTNKASSAQWFAARDIPVPSELNSWSGPLPMVAKPLRNVGEDGVVRYPVLLNTPDDLEEFLARDDRAAYFPQEFVTGTSYYLLAYIARNGRSFATSQINLGQQANGKSIVVAETSDFHHSATAASALHALQARGFHGFAMLEFIVGADGPRFIELNPRPWGPLQLCADHSCGIVEAFIGDSLYEDPLHFEEVRRRKPANARYLWLGGILMDLRAGRRLCWQGNAVMGWLGILRHFPSEVYLRRDSWKVFLDEVLGR